MLVHVLIILHFSLAGELVLCGVALMEEQMGKFDWSVLFPDEPLLDEENKPESVIDEKAKQLVEDAGGYGESADEAVKIIAEANKKIEDALGGNMPEVHDEPTQPTVVDTPQQEEVVDVPIGSNVQTTTTQTVFVNVETGDPISASALLLSVTENEDGSLSYDVHANALAGDTLDEGALIMNVVKNEDGSYSYDVFVNGTPGKTIGKDSIVLGTNTEDGTYSVTVNGAAGNALSQSSGLILGLDENGQWNVVTNATQGTTVNRGNLVTGDDPTVYVDADTSAALLKVATLNALANAPATKTVTVTYQSDEMPEVHDEPLMPEVVDVPINPVLDDSGMEEVHDELIDVTSNAEKDTPLLTVPTDIDAQSLQNAVLAAGDDLNSVEITVDSDSPESKKRAEILKEYIEKLNPEVTVTIKKKGGITGLTEASGTKSAKPGVHLTGEEAPELIEHRQTGTWEYVTDPTLVNLDAGDVVHNGADTKKILRRSSVSALSGQSFASGGSIPWDFSTVSNSSKASSKTAKKTNWKTYIDKLFDWIEIRLDRLQSATDKWTQQIETSIGYVAKNSAIDSTVDSISEQIKALEEAAVRYQKQAADVAKKSGLSASAIKKVQNGTMDISLYGEDTQKKIKEYQTWWEKALDVKESISDLYDTQEELINQKLDNIINQYTNMADVVQQAGDKARGTIDLLLSSGKEVTAEDYAPILASIQERIGILNEERNKLQSEFDTQMLSGALSEGSDAWYEYVKQINELDASITDAAISVNDLNDEIKNIAVTKLEYAVNSLKEAQDGIQRTVDLVEAQGRTVTEAMYKNMIDNGTKQVEIYRQIVDELKQQQSGLDVNSEKYQEIQEQISSTEDTIGSIVQSQEQWNDSIIDLKIDAVQKLKDELEETNSTYQRQLDLQKAQEDLARAQTQRKVRVYVEGQGFVYQANQKDIQEAQRNLDEKLHDESMAKLDEIIDDLGDLKETSNVYEVAGLTPVDLSELLSKYNVTDLIDSLKSSVNLDAGLSSIMSSTPSIDISSLGSVSGGGDTIVQMQPGAVVINADGADANEVLSAFTTKLDLALAQKLYS